MVTKQQFFMQIFDFTEMGVLKCSIISGMMIIIKMMMAFIAKLLVCGAPRI